MNEENWHLKNIYDDFAAAKAHKANLYSFNLIFLINFNSYVLNIDCNFLKKCLRSEQICHLNLYNLIWNW